MIRFTVVEISNSMPQEQIDMVHIYDEIFATSVVAKLSYEVLNYTLKKPRN